MTLPEWIFRSLSVLLAMSACWLLVWGWLGDRPPWRPVKTRCPKCWYDLTGVPRREDGWFCVECGHIAKNQRDLHRTRRRGWTLVPVLLLLGASVLAWVWPTIDRDGWRAAVPTWVIVRYWPIDEVAWMEGGGAISRMGDEMSRRIDAAPATEPPLASWADRVESRYRTLGRLPEAAPTIASPARAVLIRVELASTFEAFARADRRLRASWQSHDGGPGAGASGDDLGAGDGLWMWDLQDTLANRIVQCIAPDGWMVNGGRDARLRWSGTSVLVVAAPEVAADVRSYLSALSLAARLAYVEGTARTRVVALDGVASQVVIRDVGDIELDRAGPDAWISDRAELVAYRIMHEVEPDSWVDNGGEVGSVSRVSGLLIVRQSPEVQRKIDEFLAGLWAAQSK